MKRKKVLKSLIFLSLTGCMVLQGAVIGEASAITGATNNQTMEITKTDTGTNTNEGEVETVIVSATKLAEPASSVPARVDVVTSEDLERHKVTSVSEALQSLPGVYMSQVAEGGIMMRGFNSTDILVMVNGQPINSSWSGVVDWNQIPVQSIDRIEVVRGAGSSLYGGKAVGGTINIITKEPLERFSGTIAASVGSHGTYKESVQVQGKLDKHWSIGLGFEQKQTDGWRGYYRTANVDKKAKKTSLKADLHQQSNDSYVIGGRGEKSWKNKAYNLEVGYAFDDTKRLVYDFQRTKYNYQYNNPFSYILDKDGNMVFSGTVKVPSGDTITFKPYQFIGYYGQRAWDVHTLRYADDTNQLNATLGYTNYYENGYSSPSTQATIEGGTGGLSWYPSKTYHFDVNKVWALNKKHTLLAGISADKHSFDQTKYELPNYRELKNRGTAYEFHGGKDINYAAYMQDKILLTDRWTTYLGVRYDYYKKVEGYSRIPEGGLDVKHPSGTFSEISPKAVIEYKLSPGNKVYASYGHSFNPPILYNVYRQSGMVGQQPVLSNPDLKPETSDTLEIGYKGKLDDKTRMGLSAYHIKTKDTIRYTTHYTMDGKKKVVDFKRYENAGSSERTGVELDVSRRINPNWNMYLNYAWQKGEISMNGVQGDNYDIPRHILHAGVEYEKNKWIAVLDAQYISARQSPDALTGEYNSYDPFLIFNTSLTYKIRTNWDIQFSVNNIFDKQFYDGEAAAGRTFELGTRYRF